MSYKNRIFIQSTEVFINEQGFKDEFDENYIKKDGGQTIEVSAQVRVSEFYKKLGYNQVGDIYFDEYCEHIRMVKKLEFQRNLMKRLTNLEGGRENEPPRRKV